MGVATGCGCKEVYRFPHSTYPYSSCICSFLQQHPILFVNFFIIIIIIIIICMTHNYNVYNFYNILLYVLVLTHLETNVPLVVSTSAANVCSSTPECT